MLGWTFAQRRFGRSVAASDNPKSRNARAWRYARVCDHRRLGLSSEKRLHEEGMVFCHAAFPHTATPDLVSTSTFERCR